MPIRITRGLPALLVLAALLAGAPRAARANCAAAGGYEVKLAGTTATICQTFDLSAGCPGQGLVRRDASGAAAVLVTTCDARGCFVDECVPPGTYEYGRLDPFPCGAGCATEWYGTATATADVSACTRTLAAPVAFTGTVPWAWSSTNVRCRYQGPESDGPAVGCASSGAGPVLGVNALALGVGLLLLRRRARAAAGPRRP